MSKKEKFNSVKDLMADILPDDKEFCNELSEQIQKRQLVRKLARLRNQKCVSQDDVAAVLSCKQSRISKLENGFDFSVSIGDLAGYCEALDCELHVVLRNSKSSVVDQVKEHAFGIKDCLNKLCAIAKKDDSISSGVADFHVEALMNLVKIVSDSANELDEKNPSKIRFEVPDLAPEACSEDDMAASP